MTRFMERLAGLAVYIGLAYFITASVIASVLLILAILVVVVFCRGVPDTDGEAQQPTENGEGHAP